MIDLEDTMDNWRYYNHALIPTTPPHVEVDTSMIKDGSIWKSNSSSSKTRITNKPLSYKQIFNGGGIMLF